jgi:two-component system, OmpR family, sensor histidine kinase KdpD
LAAGEWQFHPLSTALGVLGVLGLSRDTSGPPVPPDRQVLLATMKGQAALAHERLKLEADAREVAALRQRDDLRATLLSSIGHDLKTPLSAVVAAADALAQTLPPSEILTTLGEETRRLRRFFDDLIEMTRIESGALAPRLEAIDLTDAAAAAVHDLRAETGSRALKIDVAPAIPLVKADPRLLHHILINLIGNAVKFSPAGSTVTLSARAENGVELAVTDQGTGLLPGDPAQLFDRFTRVAGTDRTGGTGLGLAIVKGFAEAMDISVTAANAPGGGAVFTLRWPQPE